MVMAIGRDALLQRLKSNRRVGEEKASELPCLAYVGRKIEEGGEKAIVREPLKTCKGPQCSRPYCRMGGISSKQPTKVRKTRAE